MMFTKTLFEVLARVREMPTSLLTAGLSWRNGCLHVRGISLFSSDKAPFRGPYKPRSATRSPLRVQTI